MVLSGENLNPGIFQFLTQSLKSDQFHVYRLAGDASARKYYRVVLENQSWVLMEWDPFVPDDNYPFLSVLNHFQKNHINVPQYFQMAPEQGLMLLEDLGDLTLERKFGESQTQEHSLPFYKLAIAELVKIHYLATAERNQNCTAFQIQFDTEKFLWEMNYALKHLIVDFYKIELNENLHRELQDVFIDICSTLDKEPKYISHRDYHSRNLMIKFDKIFVVDFQDARLGPVQYDLVSLFKDSYVNIDESNQELLLKEYLLQSKEHLKSPLDLEHFQNIYELQTIQRCFKACGSFSGFYNLRQDQRYLKYISPTLKRVMKSLNKFPKYKVFSDFLIDQDILGKNFG